MFSIIKSGMSSAMHELSVISNNVSNANSNGFKKSLVAFSDFAGGLLPDAIENVSSGMGSFVDETRISVMVKEPYWQPKILLTWHLLVMDFLPFKM